MVFTVLNIEADDYSVEAQRIIETVATYSAGSLSMCDGLIVRLAQKIDANILDQVPDLKVLVSATTGLNHIDLDECVKRDITVLSLKGEEEFLRTITATAEHTMGLVLALVRHVPAACSGVAGYEWDRDQFKGRDLSGKTLGIIGYGRLGTLVAQYARVFGMDILAHDVNDISGEQGVESVSLDTLLARADIVSLHASYSLENRHMIDGVVFQKMKAGAYFINTARGELVDEAALLGALNTGHLAGAALDVLDGENDLNLQGHPLVEYARGHRNLIITPHIGGATYDSMEKTEVFMAHKLKNFIEGIKV